MKGKKGVAGLDLARGFLLLLMIIAILAFATIIVLSNLNESVTDILPVDSAAVANESLSSVNDGAYSILAAAPKRDSSCTVVLCSNSSSEEEIKANNYTTDAASCSLIYTGGATDGYNNSDWKCQYTYTYVRDEAGSVAGNVSTGLASFFSNTNSWLTLLSVVVIILIIAIVIFAVQRFSAGGGLGRQSDMPSGL